MVTSWCGDDDAVWGQVNDFTGELCLTGRPKCILGPPNMLLRGCMLQNTDWVLGLVVAVGVQTKINFGAKVSTMQKEGSNAKLLNVHMCARRPRRGADPS